MPAYSQSTIRTRVAVVQEVRGQQVVVARHGRVLGAGERRADPVRAGDELGERGGTGAPRATAVALVGVDDRERVEARRQRRAGVERRGATPPTSSSRSRSSSAGSGAPGMNAVTRHGGVGEERDDLRARRRSRAAASVASRSAPRSIPSSSVSLPGSRTTTSRPAERMRKFRLVMPPSSATGSPRRRPELGLERRERRARAQRARASSSSGTTRITNRAASPRWRSRANSTGVPSAA